MGRRGFTFFEMMVTMVVLAVGLVGIYRVFGNAIHYQQVLQRRLYILNLLSDSVASAESELMVARPNLTASSRVAIPGPGQVDGRIECVTEPLAEEYEGLSALHVTLEVSLLNRGPASFRRSSLVYHNEIKTPL